MGKAPAQYDRGRRWSPVGGAESRSGFMSSLSGVGASPQWIHSQVQDDKVLGETL